MRIFTIIVFAGYMALVIYRIVDAIKCVKQDAEESGKPVDWWQVYMVCRLSIASIIAVIVLLSMFNDEPVIMLAFMFVLWFLAAIITAIRVLRNARAAKENEKELFNEREDS